MIKKLISYTMLLAAIATTAQAQEIQRPQPRFWFGVSGAANFNFYTGTTQTLNPELKVPAAFHKAFGVAPYGSVLFEYQPNPMWGLMLNLAYDGRGAKFNDVMAPCDCPATLKTNLSYLSFEPSLRFAPFSNGFYLFVGPAYSYIIANSFTYTQKLKPDVKGEFSDVRKGMFSAQIGAGYDIPLSAVTSPTQFNLSPFISYHPYFGQDPRTVESLSLTTFRLGVALKFGKAPVTSLVVVPPVVDGGVKFSIRAPLTVPEKRNIKETFPLRNYVFFDEGSSEIPTRYVKLNKEQAVNFKEAQSQEPAPKDVAGRADRQLAVYYNILNILGDRMRSNPTTTVRLIGASAGKGPELGKSYAESAKRYLVDVFGIEEGRITTEGHNQPLSPSEPSGSTDAELLVAGDRRVDIVSTSPTLLAPLQITAVQQDPLDSRVVFKAEPGANQKLESWSLEIKDDKGAIQNFGPYTGNQESISGNTILGNRNEGNYKVTLTGKLQNGNLIRQESNLYLIRNAAPKEQGLRFSVLFDFDQSKTVSTYEKFLKESVAPLIPENGTVLIHGHTDIIGDEQYNTKLSMERAQEAQRILENALSATGKKGVKFEIYGFGEEAKAAPFENQYPEERYYNRTVIIDIVPTR